MTTDDLTPDDLARFRRRVVTHADGCQTLGRQTGRFQSLTVRGARYYARYVALRAAGRHVPEGQQALALGSCRAGCINPNHMVIGPRRGAAFVAHTNRGGRPVGVRETQPRQPYYRYGSLVFPKRDGHGPA